MLDITRLKNYFYLVDECEECGHKSYHPVRWFRSLFKKEKPQKPHRTDLFTPYIISEAILKRFEEESAITEIMRGIPTGTESLVRIGKVPDIKVKMEEI